MQIGVDARSMTMPRARGTGRNLLDAYCVIPTLRNDWQFVLYHARSLPDNTRAAGDTPWQHLNVRCRRIDMPGDRLGAWLHVRLPLAARLDRVDLLHFPANAAPAWCPVPFVLTVHDLIPLKLPDGISPRRRHAFERGLRRGVARAAHIITVSKATRADLHRDFGVPLERMTVIPWAPDTRIAATATQARSGAVLSQVRTKYGLAERWLLTFSGGDTRKNAHGVLEGFAHLAPGVRRGIQVVLVGCEPADYRARLAAAADRLGISGQCRILGFVPHADLPALLAGSRGLLMPSRYEGFGLPILDAFACDVPVLTSNVSSMPEVAGNAALYCDPNDSASIATGIEQLLDTATAANLVQKGRERLALFNWPRTAQAMCMVYERALARQPAAQSSTARICEDGPR
jgi:glycosyltransferase involved in cell wall biosynthesis